MKPTFKPPTQFPSGPSYRPTSNPTSPTPIPTVKPTTPTAIPTIIPTRAPTIYDFAVMHYDIYISLCVLIPYFFCSYVIILCIYIVSLVRKNAFECYNCCCSNFYKKQQHDIVDNSDKVIIEIDDKEVEKSNN
jgi:hypothetical protein